MCCGLSSHSCILISEADEHLTRPPLSTPYSEGHISCFKSHCENSCDVLTVPWPSGLSKYHSGLAGQKKLYLVHNCNSVPREYLNPLEALFPLPPPIAPPYLPLLSSPPSPSRLLPFSLTHVHMPRSLSLPLSGWVGMRWRGCSRWQSSYCSTETA